jgi:hypothetical protein
MAAIFDLPITLKSRSILISPIVFPDPKNVGVAVEISFLSCIHAEIRYTYLLPVYGRHFDFRLAYSHQLYIGEFQRGCLTVR